VADFDLTTLDGLLGAVARYDADVMRRAPAVLESSGPPSSGPLAGPRAEAEVGEFTGTHCPHCGESRRMRLVARDDRCAGLNPREIRSTGLTLEEVQGKRDPLAYSIGWPPCVFTATCLQCQRALALVVYPGPPPGLIVLGGAMRGVATQGTPPALAFYLEQAYRARAAGAYTAAAAMYRSALEQFLADQGLDARQLNDRIRLATEAAPRWLEHLDDELMHALRELGNVAVHGGEGDPGERDGVYRSLVSDFEQLFAVLLDDVYELPARRDALRQRFRAARDSTSS
jgi:hypothetical protein